MSKPDLSAVQPPTGTVQVSDNPALDPLDPVLHAGHYGGRGRGAVPALPPVQTVGIDPLGHAHARGDSSRARRKGDRAEYHLQQVRNVLDPFRVEHGWQPGQVWNPWAGAYEDRAAVNRPEGLENLRPRPSQGNTPAARRSVNPSLTGDGQ